jgi:uncharacterized repeat protein (TIGR02543 family)
VTYDGNGSTGGSVPTDSNTYAAGVTVTVLANTGSLVKTGSTFSGWNTAANGSGTSYATGATFILAGSGNVTLFAKWTALTAQVITGFAPVSPVIFGASPATLTATGGASGSPIVFATTSANTICTVSGSTVTYVGVGVCNLTANQAAGGNFSAAAQATASITINGAPQAITGFAPTTPVVMGASPATLTATGGASGNPIVFATTSANTICTVSGSAVTFVGVGVCNLTANQAAGGNYAAAPQVTASITINAVPGNASVGIPTLSEWGLIILASLMALFGMRQVARTRRH